MEKKSITCLILLTIFMAACTTSEEEPLIRPRFNHTMLYTENLENSIHFYTTAFDLNVTNKLKNLKRTSLEGSVTESEINIAFLKFPGQDYVLEIAEISFPERQSNQNAAYHHVGIEVIDITSALRDALQAGATIIRPIETVEMNDLTTKHVFLKAPQGETIELMQIVSGKF